MANIKSELRGFFTSLDNGEVPAEVRAQAPVACPEDFTAEEIVALAVTYLQAKCGATRGDVLGALHREKPFLYADYIVELTT